jgi:hypothetical protein
MRISSLMIAILFTVPVAACAVPDGATQRNAELRACGLEADDSITPDVDLHACAPGQTRKTTICHIPPGNPGNAHTLCIGDAAVAAHVEHHHDTLGPCAHESPCGGGDGSGSGGVIL